MSTMDDWIADVMVALDLPAEAFDRDALLDLTRDVAHGVARPAAPLTSYLVGVAAGRAGGSAQAVREAVAVVGERVSVWRDAHPESAPAADAPQDRPAG